MLPLKVEFRWTHLLRFLRAGFGVGCSCCLWALVSRVISEMELAWLFCSCTWGGSLEPDGMEFLEPKCSVLGLCRSVASVASIKHGFWEPWPEAAMVPAPWPRPCPGSRACRS